MEPIYQDTSIEKFEDNNFRLDLLPKDIIFQHIFIYIDFQSFINLRITCKQLNYYVNIFWKPTIKSEKIIELKETYQNYVIQNFMKRLRCSGNEDGIFFERLKQSTILEYINIYGRNNFYVDYLPSSVTSIDMGILLNNDDLSRLGSNVESIRIWGLYNNVDIKTPMIFPNNLKKLSLPSFIHYDKYIDDIMISKLPSGLTSLNIVAKGITIDGVRYLPSSLRTLKLNRFQHDFKDFCVFPSLTKLRLNKCYNVSDIGLLSVFGKLSTLQKLEIMGYTNITNFGISKLPLNVKKLILRDYRFPNDVNHLNWFQNERICFKFNDNIEQLKLDFATKFERIVSFNIPKKVYNLEIEFLSAFSKVEILFDIQYITTQYIQKLYLKKIFITNKYIMGNLPNNIKNLTMNWCSFKEEETLLFPKNLFYLDMSCNSKLRNTNIINLPENLITLNLSECETITNVALRFLPKNLHSLTMKYCNISDKGIKSLPNNLKELEIHSPKITSKALQNLPPNLITLKLFYAITDDVIKCLPKKLEILYLHDCYNLTNNGLKKMEKHLVNLQYLLLSSYDSKIKQLDIDETYKFIIKKLCKKKK